MVINGVTPTANDIVAQDEENSFGVGSRIVRILGAVNVNVVGFAGNPVTHVWIGAYIANQDINLGAETSLVQAQHADRRWLWRTPMGIIPPGTGLGLTYPEEFIWSERFDWRFRAGHGVELHKDDAVFISAGVQLPVGVLEVNLEWSYIVLAEVH